MTWLLTILASDFMPYLAGAVTLIGSWLVSDALGRRKGRKQAETDAKEADNAHADEIRDRVDRNLDERVRDMDGRGFRD